MEKSYFYPSQLPWTSARLFFYMEHFLVKLGDEHFRQFPKSFWQFLEVGENRGGVEILKGILEGLWQRKTGDWETGNWQKTGNFDKRTR